MHAGCDEPNASLSLFSRCSMARPRLRSPGGCGMKLVLIVGFSAAVVFVYISFATWGASLLSKGPLPALLRGSTTQSKE